MAPDFTWLRIAASNLQQNLEIVLVRLRKMSDQLDTVEMIMADNSPLLNQLATNLRSFAQNEFANLVADNTRLASRVAELEGEDVAEAAAADNAVAAFNELTAPVTESPDVPVEIPPVDAPTEEPSTEPAPSGDPTEEADTQPVTEGVATLPAGDPTGSVDGDNTTAT